MAKSPEPLSTMRLDKWLWAARFFKTRQLAVEAINGGKVHLNGQRVKPGKTITVGAGLEIQKGGLSWTIEVRALCAQRRPASEAALLYTEDEQSRLRRQHMVLERRELGIGHGESTGRPNKRDRRLIQRFKTPANSRGQEPRGQ
ncbi:RNA-binding protein S4 [Thiocapsa imhoffii]|uniref:Heat shock protein 15 n=1 Tax=Thiocapsa imhoffii TaxID=382777 RepID=A0A9X1BAC9_9GAMM|nr:S4 domain-containing protein [Thiocapsa imhoffii]MBK1645980.1 RNA-binding protein S4 [Thiocapsa imhoffii]